MKHARPDYDRFQDPISKIPDDEPVMLFRGQDIFVPATLEFYADLAEKGGAKPELVSLVRNHVEKMIKWQTDQGIAKIPDL